MVPSETEVDPSLGWIWHPLPHRKKQANPQGGTPSEVCEEQREESAAEWASREEGRDY